MRKAFFSLAVVALAAAVVLPASCGVDPNAGTCAPGEVVNCACPGKQVGTATCLNSGEGFNDCACPEPTGPSAVASSSANTGASSGGGGTGGMGGMGGMGGAGGGTGGSGGAGGAGGNAGGAAGAGGVPTP